MFLALSSFTWFHVGSSVVALVTGYPTRSFPDWCKIAQNCRNEFGDRRMNVHCAL